MAFIESWPDWPAKVAALYGPPGSGKSHLVSIWRDKAGARIISAADMKESTGLFDSAVAIEDVDSADASPERDAALFAVIESGGWVLLTGRTPPAAWTCSLPDLASRFSALTTLRLEEPDEALLIELARKLFSDRQLFVPDAVIGAMLRRLDRSPAAICNFVAELDAAALAASRPVSLALVRSLLMEETGPP
ncbi:MAG TPA: hypothetical protein VGK90_10330 [Rhizomicrobium sp.]